MTDSSQDKPVPEDQVEDRVIHRRKILIVATVSVMMLTVCFFFFDEIKDQGKDAWDSIGPEFFIFVLGGFIAQMIDGCLGMAYGVTASTFLMSFGVSPAAASASIHASEIFTTLPKQEAKIVVLSEKTDHWADKLLSMSWDLTRSFPIPFYGYEPLYKKVALSLPHHAGIC